MNAQTYKCRLISSADDDVPSGVLMGLPSPDEIARRAEEAKAKAQAALAAQGRQV